MCNLEEFLLLNKHMEKETYNYKVCCNVFHENADVVVDGEKGLSFDKFSVICVENNLLSEEAQDRFIEVQHKKEVEHKFTRLQKDWGDAKTQFEQKFRTFVGIEEHERAKWLEILEVLTTRILKPSSDTQINEQTKYSDQKPILIALKILEAECANFEKISDRKQQIASQQLFDDYAQDDDFLSLMSDIQKH